MSRSQVSWNLPKPSKTLRWLMIALGLIWLTFALAINWGGGGQAVFLALAGDSVAVLHGEVWRLLTAALLHTPTGPGSVLHIAISLMLLYFFGPALEDRWGPKRLLLFLAGSAVFSFAVESLLFLALPTVAKASWYGGMVMADAAVVAWAIANRKQTVLFFVIPMRPMVMVAIMAGWHVLQLITRQGNAEGMFAPFAAMGAGYLFNDASPLKRVYLKWKLTRLQAEVDTMQKRRKGSGKSSKASHLRVIPGGDDDPKGPMVH